MARKKNAPSLQNGVVKKTDSVQQTSVDIPLVDLKNRFKARSIPLESDFADLIDVADCGRKAVGLSPDVTPVSDTGLTLDNNTGQLRVLEAEQGGIIVDEQGVRINTSIENGLDFTNDNQLKIATSTIQHGLKNYEDGLGLADNSCMQIFSSLHRGYLCGDGGHAKLFVSPYNHGIVYVYGALGNYPVADMNHLPLLDGIRATTVFGVPSLLSGWPSMATAYYFSTPPREGSRVTNIYMRSTLSHTLTISVTLESTPPLE